MTTTDETALAKAEEYRNNLVAKGEQIRADKDLTVQAKSERIGALWNEAATELPRLRAEYEEARAVEIRRAEYAAVRPPKTDPARMASYRPALDRATAAVKTDGGLRDLLEQAEMTGDEDQALAAYTVALREGDEATANAYLADRPERRAAYDRHQARVKSGLSAELHAGMVWTMPSRPRFGNSW